MMSLSCHGVNVLLWNKYSQDDELQELLSWSNIMPVRIEMKHETAINTEFIADMSL